MQFSRLQIAIERNTNHLLSSVPEIAQLKFVPASLGRPLPRSGLEATKWSTFSVRPVVPTSASSGSTKPDPLPGPWRRERRRFAFLYRPLPSLSGRSREQNRQHHQRSTIETEPDKYEDESDPHSTAWRCFLRRVSSM